MRRVPVRDSFFSQAVDPLRRRHDRVERPCEDVLGVVPAREEHCYHDVANQDRIVESGIFQEYREEVGMVLSRLFGLLRRMGSSCTHYLVNKSTDIGPSMRESELIAVEL